MANENLWKNDKNSETQSSQQRGASESRYVDAKEQAEQTKYDAFYNRVQTLIDNESLDFKKVADHTRLKVRKVRDTLLFRLTSGDMIQLFGHKEGVCYICGIRIRSKCYKEPLCLTCLEIIDEAIREIHGAPSIEPELSTSEEPENNASQPTPEKELTLQEKYEKLLTEVTQYRAQYGPLEPDQPDKHSATTQDIKEKTESEAKAENSNPLSDILGSDDDEDALLTPDVPAEEIAPGAMRHFGFQRINSRN